MAGVDLKSRTKAFAIQVIQFVESLPRSGYTAPILSKQLVRSGTSVGANYRAACRAKSRPDFISKMGTVEEEADEVMYWLELLDLMNIADRQKLKALHREADELVAIAISSIKTSRKN